MSEIRRILIGSPNDVFAKKLKSYIETKDYKVTDIIVLAEHLIETIELSYHNDEPIYGIIITTDLATKGNDKRLEYLADCLLTIRSKHSEIKIAVLANEPEGHPLLTELVNMGIYNIFLKTSSSTINAAELLHCLDVPKEFAEVAKFRDYKKDIQWRALPKGANEITVRTEIGVTASDNKFLGRDSAEESDIGPSKTQSESSADPAVKTFDQFKVPEASQQRRLIIDDDELEEFRIPFPTVKERVVFRDRIYGTAVIGMIGTGSGVGTTHSAVTLANYLSRKGNKVALIECNESEDFKYIELAYEGVKDESRSLLTKSFEIHGVNYIKFDSAELDLIPLMQAEYNFIVLDLGSFDDTRYFEEFLRADIQIVVASGGEWKQRHLKKFFNANIEYEHQGKWNVLLPLVDNQSRSDIESDLNREKIYRLPYHPDAFVRNEETDAVFENILVMAPGTAGHQSKSNRKIKMFAIGLSVLSVVLIALLILK
ncbi:ParA family protein [Paenibacillus sp. Y412MC10]|uniref:ParA family protein n=1 Tax=Geobacillus sp. (strain Y412MC10) TaxID=481743 RepID=UPI0011AB6A8A|nr:ParA family protein [Paenibacillus sp. Y412MC10]